ncbi:MAG TPA: carbohydrate ABC transporter permease, partial [Candidatus Omnitrophica bacterium]|nr:carbohydrate ABC transporter permease [Candidatus Omnitrophota bacterium]
MNTGKALTLQKIKESRKKRERFKKLIAYLFLTLFGLTMVLPFIWMVSTSLKLPQEVFTEDPLQFKNWIPENFVWKNYIEVFKVIPFFRFYINSIFVAICVTLGVVLTSSFSGYAFSRLRFPGRDKLFFAYIATMMIPGAVIIIPVFILMRVIGWIDTYKALIIPAMFTA